MKLKPTMFYDPEPKQEDYCFDMLSPGGLPEFEKDHNEWKRRQKRVQHRLRFYGFTRTEDTDVIELTNGKLTITFEDGGPGVGVYYENSNMCILNLYYANGLSLNSFNDICQENEINLQEI